MTIDHRRTLLHAPGREGYWNPRSLCLTALVLSILLPMDEVLGQPDAILQLRPDGPMAPIHAIEFSQDGEKLFAAGEEKLVQVWRQRDLRFERDHSASLRHTIGPGPLGVIRAMSVSSDGRYVAAGGIATHQYVAGFTDDGVMLPAFALSRELFRQIGSVSLFEHSQSIDTSNRDA